MKRTLRDMEQYIFHEIVLRLKGVEGVPSFEYDSPVGRNRKMYVRFKDVLGSPRFRYQREIMESERPLEVYFSIGYDGRAIAEYDKTTKTLKVFKDVAEELGASMAASILIRQFKKESPYYHLKVFRGSRSVL